MKKILSLITALIFGISQIACASTNVPAKDVTVNTSSFSHNLNSSDNTVQLALNALDQVLGGGSGAVNWGSIGGLLSNQTDLQNALNAKISGVNWGQIGGTLSNQTDLNTALNGKVATSITVNGHALTGNVVVTKSDVGLGNVQNVDTTNASNITSGTILNSLLANIPNTAINWTSLNANIQSTGINWSSIPSNQLQGSWINWASINQLIQAGNVNWTSLLSSQIQTGGINWTSLNKVIQATGINWSSLYSSQINSAGINWANLNQTIQSPAINWTSLLKSIQTSGINWQSVINSEIQEQGINWTSLNANIVETAFNFTNVTTGNATSSAHGLLPVLPGIATEYLNGTGGFSTPPGSGTISSSTIGYYAQYTGATTIGGISILQAGAINWPSLNASQIQNTGVNWSSLNKNINSQAINWANLNNVIQSPAINWTSLVNNIQATGINWTSLVNNIQATGVNWTSLSQSIQSTGVNWASVVHNIQTTNINWSSVINMELQGAGINWASIVALIQASAINWPSVNASQILGSGVNWTSVGNINTGGTITSNGFNTASSLAGLLKLYELPSNGNTYLAFQAPNSIPSTVTWTFPSADSAGCFQSNGSGTISIGTCGGTVNSGTQYQMGYYASTGTAISGLSSITTDSSHDLTIGGSLTTSGTTQNNISDGLLINSAGNSTSGGGDLSFKNSVGTTIFNIGATSNNITIPVTGTTQCLHVNSSGLVTGTGTDCSSGSSGLSSFLSPNNTILIGGTLTNPTVDINWTDVNGIAAINNGAINYPSINSVAKINTGGINWNSVINSQVQSQGVNWTSVINQQIQHQGVNWTSLNSDIKNTGINWSSINAGASINSGAFTSITGSGNQVVLSTLPTLSAALITGNLGIGGTIPNIGIGTISPLQSLTVNGNTSIAGGLSTYSITDPTNDWGCEVPAPNTGAPPTTTGNINSGTNSLTSVGSTTGWAKGMGIDVAQAGNSGGTVDLITTITNISGSTFTLAANSANSGNLSGTTIYHDDIFCLNAALVSGKNPLLRIGSYQIQGTLNYPVPVKFWGAGMGNPITKIGLTNIYQRSLTANTNNITSSNVDIQGINFVNTGTTTAGYLFKLDGTAASIWNDDLFLTSGYGSHGGIEILGTGSTGVSSYRILNDSIYILNGVGNTDNGLYVDNGDSGPGDNFITNTQIGCSRCTLVYITSSDTELFANDKFQAGDPCLKIDDSNGTVANQEFTGVNMESSSSATGPVIVMSANTTDVIGTNFVGDEINNENGGPTISIGSNIDYISASGNNIQGGTPPSWGIGTHNQIGLNTCNGFSCSMVINSNVGIGTSAPQSAFVVSSNGADSGQTGPDFQVNSGATSSSIIMGRLSGTGGTTTQVEQISRGGSIVADWNYNSGNTSGWQSYLQGNLGIGTVSATNGLLQAGTSCVSHPLCAASNGAIGCCSGALNASCGTCTAITS